MKYPTKKIVEICKVSTGKRDANHAVEGGVYPFFTCADKPIAADTFAFSGECIILPGNGANVGLVLFYNGKFEAYQRTYVLNNFNIGVYPRYIFHHLLRFWKIKNSNSQYGSATNYIKMQNFEDYEIPLPPLPEQKRIAAILDKADAIGRKRQKAIKLADEFLRATFLDMFGDPVINPKGWPFGTIRELISEAKYGTAKKAIIDKGKYPILRMNNITYNGEMDFTDLKYIDLEEKEVSKYIAKKGDLLFNRTNSKELVGKTAVFESSTPMAIAGYLVRARTNERSTPHYISSYLNSSHGKATLMGMCKSIVGMANINAQELQNISIMVPPVDLQKQYTNLVWKVQERKKRQLEAANIGDTLFRSLTQRAFRGEL